MYLASDNIGPVPDQVFDALKEANTGTCASYGADPLTEEVVEKIRDIFEAPEAAVYMVATGTAANALALATLAKPWDTIFCTSVSHINEDECNAPEFFTAGAKLTALSTGDKLAPEALQTAIDKISDCGVHGPQLGPVSLTQASEKGTIYTLEEIDAILAIVKTYGMPTHMDGARFANALIALNCSPAEMTWKRGIDALSFGCSKNGLMSAEAVVFFDPSHAWEFELRRKRAGHLFSKHRFLSAQIKGYLDNDLWLSLAHQANENATYLADQLRALPHVEFDYPQEANMMFVNFARKFHRRAIEAGATYNFYGTSLEDYGPDDEVLHARLVCDWSINKSDIDRFVRLISTN